MYCSVQEKRRTRIPFTKCYRITAGSMHSGANGGKQHLQVSIITYFCPLSLRLTPSIRTTSTIQGCNLRKRVHSDTLLKWTIVTIKEHLQCTHKQWRLIIKCGNHTYLCAKNVFGQLLARLLFLFLCKLSRVDCLNNDRWLKNLQFKSHWCMYTNKRKRLLRRFMN